jgi:hypothetical protein
MLRRYADILEDEEFLLFSNRIFIYGVYFGEDGEPNEWQYNVIDFDLGMLMVGTGLGASDRV